MILFENRASEVLYKVLVNIPQKKFILPLNVCPIVPDTFVRANKEFVFVDISLSTLCIDEDLVFKKILEDKTIDGILFVYTFGIELDIEPFYQKLKALKKNMFIIDDRCPCIQDFTIDIQNSYSDLTLFSSGYSKFIDLGYGGYGFVKDKEFKHIFDDKSEEKEFLEYKDTVLQAIPKMIQHKKDLNKIYSQNLPNKHHLGAQYNNWRFSILVDNKDEILDEIFKIDGLFASSHYPQVDYDYVKTPKQNTNTNHIHKNILNLFNDFRFTKEKAYQIIDIINKLI